MEKELNTINEKLQDALSLLIILENDFQSQHTDEVYQRTIHIIHEILKSALKQGDNLEDLFMNVVRKNQKAGEIHG